MSRTLSAVIATVLLVAAPAVADEYGKSQTDTVKPDGTKVTVKKKKDLKDDGTGEVKSEVTTENQATGVETSRKAKVSKEKNSDGTTTTKARKETEVKN